MPAHDGAEGHLTGVDGVKLWYRVVGEGSETLVVPCCGNADDLAGLARPGRRTVFYDVRNRGRSDPVGAPAQGFSPEVGDVAAVRVALGVTKCALFGWSYHAGVMAAHALEHPGLVTHLALVSPVAPRSGTATRPGPEPDPADLARLDQLQAEGLSSKDPAAWCAAWRSVYVRLQLADPDAYERMAAVCHLANERPDHVVGAMVGVFASMGSYDWREPLGALACPLLVIHGDEDSEPLDSAYEWAAAVERGQVATVDGAGQLAWVDRPETVFALVDDFLSTTPGS
ncbi:MAG: alpha/beta hydrolase [Acidimicrobiia bacterium]|nr:alpha/beta hydrolase [Acidimicrobiia bacterium]